jgi:hypothetical protein
MSYELAPEKEAAIVAIEAHIDELSKDATKNIEIMAHLQMAIVAIRFSNCGCGLCLAHNDMKCPRLYPRDEGQNESNGWTTTSL